MYIISNWAIQFSIHHSSIFFFGDDVCIYQFVWWLLEGKIKLSFWISIKLIKSINCRECWCVLELSVTICLFMIGLILFRTRLDIQTSCKQTALIKFQCCPLSTVHFLFCLQQSIVANSKSKLLMTTESDIEQTNQVKSLSWLAIRDIDPIPSWWT